MYTVGACCFTERIRKVLIALLKIHSSRHIDQQQVDEKDLSNWWVDSFI